MSTKSIDENLKAHFLSLYGLTIADNNVHPKELETLYQIGLEYGISKEEICSIVISPNSTMIAPNTTEEKIAYLYNLTRIAYADGKIVDEEKALIKKYVEKFGFPAKNSTDIVNYFLESVGHGKTLDDIINDLK